jgi:hypothetical protein
MAKYLARANAARLELVLRRLPQDERRRERDRSEGVNGQADVSTVAIGRRNDGDVCRKRHQTSTKFTRIEHRRHPDLLSDAPQRPALPNLRHHPLRQQAHRVRHVGGRHVAKVLHGHDVIHAHVGERAKQLLESQSETLSQK